MTMERKPARVTSPGKVLSKELEARGWTQRDLAAIMGRPYQAINEIIKGTKQITPDTARELAMAFGTSMEFWMNLEANYRLFLAEEEDKEKGIERRSRVYSLAPVREIVRREWIQGSDDTNELERQVCSFLEIQTIDETPKVYASYRISESRIPYNTSKAAWVRRVEQLARQQRAGDFHPDGLRESIPKILALTQRAEQAARLPYILQESGIRFIIVPHLPHTYLDGAALSVDEKPVIAVTLRYDRIDWFWFTVLHELAHVLAGHPAQLDSLFEEREAGVAGDGNEERQHAAAESRANEMARNWLLDPDALDRFIYETRPHYSKARIEAFAAEQRRHPGIVLGQLQHRGEVEFRHLRSMLEKVRPYVKEWIDSPGPKGD
jgi:HTH-type transcriptional regulator/antitoxin HigA